MREEIKKTARLQTPSRAEILEKVMRIKADLQGIEQKISRLKASYRSRTEALRKIEKQITGELPKASRRTDHER